MVAFAWRSASAVKRSCTGEGSVAPSHPAVATKELLHCFVVERGPVVVKAGEEQILLAFVGVYLEPD